MSVRRLSMMICAAALVVSAAAPASASESVSYGGTFVGPIVYNTCTPAVSGTKVASGTWRVNVHDQKATARFVINVNGVPHVAYTAQMTRLTNDDATFEATMITGAGPLVVMLVGDVFTYRIARYISPWDGTTCDSVTYSGTLA